MKHNKIKRFTPLLALALAATLILPALAVGNSVTLEYDAMTIDNVVYTDQVTAEDPIFAQDAFPDWGWNLSGFTAVAPVTVELIHEAELYVMDPSGARIPLTVSKPAPYDYKDDMLPGTRITITEPGSYAVYCCCLNGGDAGMGGEGRYTRLNVITAEEAAAYSGFAVTHYSGIIRYAENKHAMSLAGYLIPAENGNSNTYVKLRDVAEALSGTAAQFDVGWDQATSTITITTGVPYSTENPYTMGHGSNDYRQAVPNTSKILLNRTPIELSAYTIEENNYFMLRDLGQSIGFNVYWNAETSEVFVDAVSPYTGNP